MKNPIARRVIDFIFMLYLCFLKLLLHFFYPSVTELEFEILLSRLFRSTCRGVLSCQSLPNWFQFHRRCEMRY